MPDSRPPSLRDIARVAGVSAMTVSRALRNSPLVAQAQAHRIRELAGRMVYSLNPYLSCWMQNVRQRQPVYERETIAFICPYAREEVTMKSVREGAERFAGSTGYRVERFPLENYPDPRVLFRTLRHRGIRGVIIASLDIPLPDSLWQHSVVWTHAPRDRPNAEYVDHDYYEEMILALEKLTAYGYRRIAYWSIGLIKPHQRWDVAYRQFQSELAPESRLPIFKNYGTAGFPERIQWLEAHRPDALVSVDSSILPGLKWHCPGIVKDLAWASLGVHSDPDVAGIEQHLDLVGENAARMVTRKMELNEVGPSEQPRSFIVHPTWRDGPSAPPLNVPSRAK